MAAYQDDTVSYTYLLEDEVKKLTEANQALTSQNTMLQQQSDAALTTAVAALPDPTTAQTTNLPDLIPQLTDAVYVVRDVYKRQAPRRPAA